MNLDVTGKAQLKENDTSKPIPEEVVDEVCQNEEYSETKAISTASRSTTPSSTLTWKPVFFDYYTLTFDDMSDPAWSSGSAIFFPCNSLFSEHTLGVFWHFLDVIQIWKKKKPVHKYYLLFVNFVFTYIVWWEQ